MNMQSLRGQSLQARLALSTLAIFLLSLWLLCFYASTLLRQDMVRISGQQQFTTVAVIASHLEDELEDRFQALKASAGQVTPALLQDRARLQTLLAQDRLLGYLFNAGVFVTRADGTAIAEAPVIGRVGLNYRDRDHIASALQQGKASVGRPIIGKQIQAPSFAMTVPIRDAQGRVIGALAGAIDLSRPNFLGHLMQNPYGLTGGYLLVAQEAQVVVAATDKSRIMQAPGNTALAMRHIGGYEGSDVYVNGKGVEVLASVKGIPVAKWYLASILPTAEAFAPAHDMQQRLLWATLLLSVLAYGLTWWLLQRQWFPLLATVEKLAIMANEHMPLCPLPVPQDKEVAEWITGINRVLKTLQLRETALLESEAFRRAIIDSVAAEIFVLDRQGLITAVNQQCQQLATQNAFGAEPSAARAGVGTNYLQVCRAATGSADEACALQTAEGIQAVLERRWPSYTLEYPCHTLAEQQWFMLVVTPLHVPSGGAVVAHHNITARKRAEAGLLSAKAEAEMANHAKSRFLAAASHDLRQPLAALSNFPLDDVCAALHAIHGARAAAKGLQLRFRSTAHITLCTDRHIFYRLVGNLLDNAVQYTAQGGVLMATRHHAGKRWIEVWDTGLGIAQDQIPGIFEEFRQLGDGARNRGSGLGLAIVAKSAALLGLDIRVRSRPGRGSLFAVELPQGAMPALGPAPTQAAGPTVAPGFTIGLVEDNLQVLNALVLGLQILGHTVFAGCTGAALLEQLGDQTPDVVVSDYRLGAGEMGLDVVEAVRARFGARLPVIILTGETLSDPLRALGAKGIAVHFKPVSLTALQTSLQQAVLSERGSHRAAAWIRA